MRVFARNTPIPPANIGTQISNRYIRWLDTFLALDGLMERSALTKIYTSLNSRLEIGNYER